MYILCNSCERDYFDGLLTVVFCCLIYNAILVEYDWRKLFAVKDANLFTSVLPCGKCFRTVHGGAIGRYLTFSGTVR